MSISINSTNPTFNHEVIHWMLIINHYIIIHSYWLSKLLYCARSVKTSNRYCRHNQLSIVGGAGQSALVLQLGTKSDSHVLQHQGQSQIEQGDATSQLMEQGRWFYCDKVTIKGSLL